MPPTLLSDSVLSGDLESMVRMLESACAAAEAGLLYQHRPDEWMRIGTAELELPANLGYSAGQLVRVQGRQATLHRPDGRLCGLLAWRGDAPVDDRTQTFLEDLGRQILRTLERHRALLLANLRQRLLQGVLDGTTLTDGLQHCLAVVCDALGWPVGHALLRNGAELNSARIWHRPPGEAFHDLVEVTEALTFGPDVGLPGIVLATQRPMWIADAARDPRFVRGAGRDLGVRGAFGVPLSSEGQLLGVLEFFATAPQEPEPDLLEALGSIGPHLGRALHLRRALAELLASEQLKSAMLGSALDCIVAIDEHSHILEFNPAAEHAFGWTRAEILGQTLTDTIIPPEHRDAHSSGLRRYLETGEQRLLRRRVEITALRRNGEVFPVELAIVEVAQAGERRFTAFLRDLTQYKQLEEQLRESQRLDAMGQLAGGIAHDFNNILSGILGFASFVLDALPAEHPNRADVEAIRTAGERGAALVRQLLLFTRREALQAEPLDVNAAIIELQRLLSRTIGEDVELVPRLGADLPPVSMDAGQLQQILMNLALNARDAMPQGGRLVLQTRVVTLGEQDAEMHAGLPPGEYVQLSVADTGIGMTPDVQRRLFEPFFTTKPRGHGTGLGLSIVYGIVQQALGGITVYSEVGKGTTFHVYLPALAGQAAAAAEPREPEEPRRGQGEVVLVAEDEEQVREIVKRSLAMFGYEVLAAASAKEALGLAQDPHQRIDLLLTDVMMPYQSGPELAVELLRQRPELRVLYMSGYADDTVMLRGGLPQGLTLLSKPFTRVALLCAVAEMLDAPKSAQP